MCQSTLSTADTAAPHSARCEGHGACATTSANVGRVVDASHDLDFPEVPFPSRGFLDAVGEAALRRLVRRHHDLLRASEIGHMLSSDDAQYEAAVEKIADFVVESCGGPATYTQKHGKGCMRTRHFPFTIDEAGRDIWLECLWRALETSNFPVEASEEYWRWMEPFSIRMINRRTMRGQPRRYPFDWVQTCMRKPVFAVCPR
jgi:hemoglobin